MFINRPLVHGAAKKEQPSKNKTSSRRQSNNNLRIKTLPSSSFHVKQKQPVHLNDVSNIQRNLIGIKDVKDMLDIQILQILERFDVLQIKTQDECLTIEKKMHKIRTKSNKITTKQGQNQTSFSMEQSQDKAYNQCKQFLGQQRQQQEKTHSRIIKQMGIQFCYLQEALIEMNNQKNTVQESIATNKNLINKKEQQIKLTQKKNNNRQRYIQEIQQIYASIKLANDKLFQSKQQSIRQKNQFIQIQADQVKFIKDIEDAELQQQNYLQFSEQSAYYNTLLKLKQKLQTIKQKDTQQIDDFFNEKIDKITKLRVNTDDRELQHEELTHKIQEQSVIIQMLSKKYKETQKQEKQELNRAESNYRKKYNRIFLNNNFKNSENNSQAQNQYRDLDHWHKYKLYLEKILTNEKRLNQIQDQKDRISQNSQFYHTTKGPSEKFDKQYDAKYLQSRNSTKMKGTESVVFQNGINRNQKVNPITNNANHPKNVNYPYNADYQREDKGRKHKSQQQINSELRDSNSKSRTPLPKLIRMEGKLQDEGKIKKQLKKFTNDQYDSQVQLQTVRTSQADGQEVIQVEFKGTRQHSKPALKKTGPSQVQKDKK